MFMACLVCGEPTNNYWFACGYEHELQVFAIPAYTPPPVVVEVHRLIDNPSFDMKAWVLRSRENRSKLSAREDAPKFAIMQTVSI